MSSRQTSGESRATRLTNRLAITFPIPCSERCRSLGFAQSRKALATGERARRDIQNRRATGTFRGLWPRVRDGEDRMLRAIRPADGLHWGLFLLATTVALTAIMTDPADARGRRETFEGPAYNPPYARSWSTPIRARSCTGPTPMQAPSRLAHQDHDAISAVRADRGGQGAARPPDGRLRPRLAAAPSKLGLRPGQTFSVEDAILALVTKSANDAADVVAEAIGGMRTHSRR